MGIISESLSARKPAYLPDGSPTRPSPLSCVSPLQHVTQTCFMECLSFFDNSNFHKYQFSQMKCLQVKKIFLSNKYNVLYKY